MKRVFQVAILITAVFVFLFVSKGSASALVEQLTLEQLTVRADSIIVGTVTNVAYQRDTAQGYICTLVTISVENTIKGSQVSDSIVIKMLGGEVDGLRLWVEDTPNFQVSERVFLFLEQGDVNTFRVCGWHQGKFTVQDTRVVETNMPLRQFTSQVTDIMRANQIPVVSANEMVLQGGEKLILPEGNTPQITPVRQEARASGNGWQTIMSEDFEGPFPGSWSRTGNPTWGKDAYNPHTGTYSAWCAEGGTAGVPPHCHYLNDMNSSMIYGPFDLSDATAAELNFYYWNKSEYDFDYFKWMASTDGNWFYGQVVSGDSGGWQYESFDLTDVYTLGDLCGESQVWIAFIFESDAYVNYEGAFIDDIELIKWIGNTPPVIDSITPSNGAAGTGTEVTISGSNFGSAQGASSVTFLYQPSSRIEAPIVSWDDTSIVAQVPGRASSGAVRVTTGAGNSNDYEFYVTFGYGGKWSGSNPMGEAYFINANTLDCSGELEAIQAAFQTWNDVSNAGFDFTYGGPTTATLPSLFLPNGSNEIMWVDYDTGSIATNLTWFYVVSLEIVESDIYFNDLYDWGTDSSPLMMDVQNVATHELGHSLRLLDLYGTADSEKTMYGLGDYGVTKARTLEPDDIAGIRWIYPNTPPVLSQGAVNPTSESVSTNFLYTVIYTDGDNDPPAPITITIDGGVPQPMTIQAGQDGDFTNGEVYEYSALGADLGVGDHDFQFAANDGMDDATGDTALHLGPTIAAPPVVNTNDATDITTCSATLNGSLDSLGEYVTVSVSFEWGAISGALDQVTTPETMTTPGYFTVALGDLVSDTTYYFKARGNDSVTVYGEELSFTTATAPSPNLFRGYVTINGVPASVGTGVAAKIDDVEYAFTVVDDQGRYGYATDFQVPADDPGTPGKEGGVNGDTVDFYVNGALGGSATFESGGYTQLDLAVSETTPTPTPVPTPTPSTYRDILLNEGWNLIGLPLMPADPNIEAVLAGIMDNVKTVWNYDLSNPGNPWTSWAPVWGGDLTQMVDCKGYWIDMKTADTLTVWGTSS